jgi:glycosyltransferase involved in cell wall biosynthesis
LKRKGLETFVKAAKYLPNVNFVLIGKHLDDSVRYLKSIAASNVSFPGFVSDVELLHFYQRAKVYCQLSIYEGLPNALCEAMLCGCVPVGTKYCGIPTAIGDTGFYVAYDDVDSTVEGINKALNSDFEKSEAARLRIKKCSLGIRGKKN